LLTTKENTMDRKRVEKYYHAICKAEKISPIPLRFESVRFGGACTTYNAKTMEPLYISFDLNRVNDIETAIIHEITHQYFLLKDKNPFPGKKDQSAKFKKVENRLVEKYLYTEFSKILWA